MNPSYQEYLQLQSKLQRISSIQELEMLIEGLLSFFSGGTRNEVYPMFHPHIKSPLYLRRATSDFMNFIQIFIRAEYEACFTFVPNNIMDLGSYIGLSAVYFANRFPNASIICVEPSLDNFEILKLNTRAYPNIGAINAGVWSHKTYLKITEQIDGDWGNVVQEMDKNDFDTINAISINDLLEMTGFDSIDFLKVDIEGSEKQVFSKNTEGWIDLVKAVACETHDRFMPGCTDAYEQLFAPRGFESFQSGEFKTFIKKEFMNNR